MQTAEEHTPPAFAEETERNLFEGAGILAAMVRSNLFSKTPTMPPAEIFEWYVQFVLYQLIEMEHHVANRGVEEAEASLNDAVREVQAVRNVVVANKQLGLEAFIKDTLNVRRLKLPVHYDSNYEGRLAF